MTADADAGTDDDADREGAEPSEEPTAEGPDELVARVAAADVEAAAAVEELRRRVAELSAAVEEREATIEAGEERIEELESKLKRARADFQNYKKRTEKRESEIRERATEDLVERLLDVRDNLLRAIAQDDDVDVRDGVEATLSTFDRILAGEGVSAIEPEPGEAVDPQRHEVVHRTESERPEGTVDEVYRPGYAMADRVLRAAQVTVSAGPAEPEQTGTDRAEADGSSEE